MLVVKDMELVVLIAGKSSRDCGCDNFTDERLAVDFNEHNLPIALKLQK